MMKTVLFINFNTSSGRLEKVVKQIPYAPELVLKLIKRTVFIIIHLTLLFRQLRHLWQEKMAEWHSRKM